jgi:uncharacterized protein (DUF58 family)
MNAKYLRPEDARLLRALTFAPRVMVEGALSGKHRSRLRGASTEFHEFRPYSAGDPPSLVDWRVFARTDRFYLKTFEQETHLECHLFVDSSASMGFSDGTRSKLDWASHFAAGLAYLVTLRQDRVSMTLFDEGPRVFLPPGGTQNHLRQLLHQLEINAPSGRTALAQALERSLPLIRHRGTVIVLSDFLDDAAAIFRALGAYLHRGFKVFLFQILTPEELDLPDQAFRRYEDLESGQHLTVHPETVRSAYQQEIREHQRRLGALAVRRGIGCAHVRTDQPWIEHLRRLAK